MKLRLKPTLVAAAFAACASAAQAAYITGTVNFASGPNGGVIYQDSGGDATTDLAAATGIQSFINAQVVEGSGDFNAVVDGTAVTFGQPWIFNPSTAMNPLWTIAGAPNFAFSLTSSFVVLQNSGFLSVGGTGMLTGTGYDPTPGTWFFTSQGVAAEGKFSWSSSTVSAPSVPDGGTTVTLLGGALIGLAGLGRKFRKC